MQILWPLPTHLQCPIGCFMFRFRISLEAWRLNADADKVQGQFPNGIWPAGHPSIFYFFFGLAWPKVVHSGHALAITLIMPHKLSTYVARTGQNRTGHERTAEASSVWRPIQSRYRAPTFLPPTNCKYVWGFSMKMQTQPRQFLFQFAKLLLLSPFTGNWRMHYGKRSPKF